MKILNRTKWLAALCVLSVSSLSATDMTDEQIEKADYKQLLKRLTPLEGSTPAQWRVTWSGDTSTTATVSWSTAVSGKKHVLHYGTKPFGKDIAKYENHLASQINGAYAINAKEAKSTKTAHYHHTVLSKLKPNTKYYFVMESDGQLSRQLYFKTSPKTGDFKLLVGGDSRSGMSDRCRVNLRMAKEFKTKPEILAFCHGGDYIVSGHSWRQWRLWLSHHELTTLDDGRVLPVIPTRGNHDGGPIFFEVFNLKKMTEKHSYWHTTQLTDDVNIVTLDTNVSAQGPQKEWLEKQLATLRPKSKWLITNYHRPLFPAVKSVPSQAAVFVPLFEKYNVDLSLESDGHCIKRTVPIRNGKKDPTGVVYIGEGGLGVGQRQPKPDHWYFQDGGYVSRGHHVMQLDFSAKQMKIETILLNGKVVDSYVMKPRSK